METVQFAILAGLSVVSIGLCIYLLAKVRTITYLLEQPVVKKMSPQLKLKPVKVDELDEQNRTAPARNPANGAQPQRGPRPGFEGGERPPRENRDNRDRPPRADRPDGERPPREGGFDRGPRSDRGDRGDRFGGREGGRDRGGRNERNDRGDRGDRFGGGGREGNREGGPGRDGNRDRNREPFTGEREPAMAEGSRPAPAAAESAPVHAAPAALAPRRPLPSTVDHDNGPKEAPVEAVSSAQAAEDALFVRNDEDMTHGRRNALKKKPRFNVAEEDSKESKEETKVL